MVGDTVCLPISPDLDAARRRHLAWVQAFGLARSRAKLWQYERWRIAELPALMYPDARGPDLDVAVDALGWFTLLDDQFDGSRRFRGAGLRRLRGELMGCLAGRTTDTGTAPLLRAWADLCPRMLDGMSARWRERITACWAEHFDACIAEPHLSHDTPDAIERYLATRRASVGGHLGTVLLERALRCELPAILWEAPEIRLIRQGVADVAVLLNDVCSLPRELARGDRVNLAILLQDRLGCGRADAVEVIVRRLRESEALIVTKQREFLARCPTLGLGAQQLAAASQFVSAAGTLVRGLHGWYGTTARYAGPEIAADGAFGFEDLIAPGP